MLGLDRAGKMKEDSSTQEKLSRDAGLSFVPAQSDRARGSDNALTRALRLCYHTTGRRGPHDNAERCGGGIRGSGGQGLPGLLPLG